MQHITTLGGTQPYIAPEKFKMEQGYASDMYSLGVTMYAAFSGTIELFNQISKKL